MAKYKSIYDTKVIVLDINFHLLKQSNLDTKLSIEKVLKKISSAQNLLLVTDDPLNVVISCSEHWDVKSGFIISTSGSCIYNIATQKIINQCFLDIELTKTILKQAIWNNLNFILNTKNSVSYVYKMNHWLISKNVFDSGKLYKLKDNVLWDWLQINNVLEKTEILSIEVLFHESDDVSREEKMKKFLNNLLPLCQFNHSKVDNTIFIYPSTTSKLLAAEYLATNKNIDFYTNSLYMGIDQFSNDLISNSYLSVVADKLLVDKLLDEQITEILSTSSGNWVTWLNEHEYLWNEPVESQYKLLFQFAIFLSLKTKEKSLFNDGKCKFLYLNIKYKELYWGHPANNPNPNWFKKKEVHKIRNEIKKIFLWSNSVNVVWPLLKNKRSSYE